MMISQFISQWFISKIHYDQKTKNYSLQLNLYKSWVYPKAKSDYRLKAEMNTNMTEMTTYVNLTACKNCKYSDDDTSFHAWEGIVYPDTNIRGTQITNTTDLQTQPHLN